MSCNPIVPISMNNSDPQMIPDTQTSLIKPLQAGKALLLAMILPAVLSACSSLPKLNPDMAMKPHRPVQMEGSKGPLTPAQSKAVLTRLKKGVDNTDIFDRHLALEEEIGGSPLTVGNKVELLIDGPPTYASMFNAINDATDHINMETYIFEDDEIGRRFSEALIAKQTSGVQVNLLYDSIGSLGTPKEFFQPMIDSGINVLEFNPVNPLNARGEWSLNNRDHRKLLVIDGKTAYVGGINISSVYSNGSSGSSLFSSSGSGGKPARKQEKQSEEQKRSDAKNTETAVAQGKGIEGLHWRDTHLRLDGPVVGEFQKLFVETWEKQKGKPLAERNYYPQATRQGSNVVRAIGSSPDDPFNLNYLVLLSAINSAESEIYLTNAYFIPDQQMVTALKEAVQRGVDVKLILPGKTDSNLVFNASRSFYDDLLSNGIKLYERKDSMLHAKTALIDGVWSTIGSTNLDWRSFLHNQEIDAIVLGQDFGGQMEAMFKADIESSHQITLEEWRKRPILSRVKEKLSKLWAYWL